MEERDGEGRRVIETERERQTERESCGVLGSNTEVGVIMAFGANEYNNEKYFLM